MSRRKRGPNVPVFGPQMRVVGVQIVIRAGPSIKPDMFPARVLAAWLKPTDRDIAYLTGARPLASSQADISRYRRAIIAGHRRRASLLPLRQGAVIRALTPEYEQHARVLRVHPAAQAYVREGWTVVLADLSQVCAMQPVVSLAKSN